MNRFCVQKYYFILYLRVLHEKKCTSTCTFSLPPLLFFPATPPYKGFLNPKLTPVTDDRGDVKDILVDYSEDYDQQMMRYGKEYGAL